MAWRFPLAARLTITLTSVSILTLASAAVMQDRAFSKGLSAVAADRLNRSTGTVERVVSDHLREVVERYAALTRNADLQASLELGDRPAVEELARSLASRSGATGVIVADAQWKVLAQVANGGQPGNPLEAWQSMSRDDLRGAACVNQANPAFARCELGRDLRPQATIQFLTHALRSEQMKGYAPLEGVPYVLVLVPVRSGWRPVGIVSFSEPLAEPVLDVWSDLVGVRVAVAEPGSESADPLFQVAHAFPGLELRVFSSLGAELATLAETRRHGALAGLVALAIALCLSKLSARDFLRPIAELRRATEQVGRGDLAVRLRSTRTDEIGDVARALDDTLDRLRSSQQQLRNVQHIARFGYWIVDLERKRVDGSPEFENVLKLPPPDKGGRKLGDFLHCFVGTDCDKLEDQLKRCFRDGTPIELDLRVSRRSLEHIIQVRARRPHRRGWSRAESRDRCRTSPIARGPSIAGEPRSRSRSSPTTTPSRDCRTGAS